MVKGVKKVKTETTLAHFLRCPDVYAGSNQCSEEEVFMVHEDESVVRQKIDDYNECLLHGLKELIDNTIDNSKREWTKKQKYIKIDVTEKSVTIKNDGCPIPIRKELIEVTNEVTKKSESHKMYRTEALFSIFRSGTNSDNTDEDDKIGKNGMGSKCVIASSDYVKIHHSDPDSAQQLTLEYRNQMSEIGKPEVKDYNKKDSFTIFEYHPCFKWFGLKKFSQNHIDIMRAMAYTAAYVSGCQVTFNGKIIHIPSITALGEAFFGKRESILLKSDNNDEVLVMSQTLEEMEEHGYRHLSFVNGSFTRNGGIHVNYNANIIGKNIAEAYGAPLKQDDAKKFFIYICNYRIKGKLEFTGQTKAALTQPKTLKRCNIEKKDINKIKKWPVWEEIGRYVQGKTNRDANKKMTTGNTSYIGALGDDGNDANFAGNPKYEKRSKCELYLTEGQSARSFIISGMGFRGGSDYVGTLALKGKINNVQKMDRSEQVDKKEICLIRKMLGLKMGCKYEKDDEIKSLRYGSVYIATDADIDGVHILCLITTFFQQEHPGLINHGVLRFLQTPIIKTKLGKEVHRFFLKYDYEKWLEELSETQRSIAIKNRKYIKGLGTNDQNAGDEAFVFRDKFQTGALSFKKDRDTEMMKIFFGKNDVTKKRQFMYDTMYNKEWVHLPKAGDMSFSEFIEHFYTKTIDEQVYRAIPYVYDGLIDSKKRVLWTAMKYLKADEEMKTAQFASLVANKSGYAHGEKSLEDVVTKMAQNIIGHQNVRYLLGVGCFGNRYQIPGDLFGASSSRYTYQLPQPLMRSVFRKEDDNILIYEEDDGVIASPKYYLPVIPWVAVNGLQTVANAFSSRFCSYNPEDLVKWCKRWIFKNCEGAPEAEKVKLIPWYRGFRGTIEKTPNGWLTRGILKDNGDGTWTIDELAIGKWGTNMQKILEKLADEKKIAKPRILIEDTNTCKAIITVKKEFNVEKALETILVSKMPMTNVTLKHDDRPVITNNIEEHLEEYAKRRLVGYIDRRKYRLGVLKRDLQIKEEKLKFIKLILDGTIDYKKIRDKDHLVQILQKLGFTGADEDEKDEDGNEDKEVADEIKNDRGRWAHLVTMTFLHATKGSVAKLEKELAVTQEEYDYYKKIQPWQLWLSELDEFLVAYKKYLDENPMHVKNVPKKGR